MLKYNLFCKTGISRCERTFSRFKNNRQGFYHDVLINPLHNIEDAKQRLKKDITAKSWNSLTLKIMKTHELLAVVNPRGHCIYHPENIKFKGIVIKDFMSSNGYKNIKDLNNRVFKGSSFSIKTNERVVTVDSKGIQCVDFTKSEYILKNSHWSKKTVETNLGFYNECRRCEDRVFDETNVELVLRDYTREYEDGMNAFKWSN